MERINTKSYDPSTPEEYIEACMRLCELAMEKWEEFPDGDGVSETPGDMCQTKTDIFRIISGCACFGQDALKLKHEIDQITFGV